MKSVLREAGVTSTSVGVMPAFLCYVDKIPY